MNKEGIKILSNILEANKRDNLTAPYRMADHLNSVCMNPLNKKTLIKNFSHTLVGSFAKSLKPPFGGGKGERSSESKFNQNKELFLKYCLTHFNSSIGNSNWAAIHLRAGDVVPYLKDKDLKGVEDPTCELIKNLYKGKKNSHHYYIDLSYYKEKAVPLLMKNKIDVVTVFSGYHLTLCPSIYTDFKNNKHDSIPNRLYSSVLYIQEVMKIFNEAGFNCKFSCHSADKDFLNASSYKTLLMSLGSYSRLIGDMSNAKNNNPIPYQSWKK